MTHLKLLHPLLKLSGHALLVLHFGMKLIQLKVFPEEEEEDGEVVKTCQLAPESLGEFGPSLSKDKVMIRYKKTNEPFLLLQSVLQLFFLVLQVLH